jgi:uncharacterized integral membrane protein (TIGR00698 family)
MEVLKEKEAIQQQPLKLNKRARYAKGLTQGLILALVITIISDLITKLPFFSIMGIMIISILLGMTWKSLIGVPTGAEIGITFSSKYLLRLGIILMGLRLNLEQIINAGFSILLIDITVITFTLILMIYLGKLFNVDRHLSVLIAVGTAVCGAAAIVAVASLINGKKQFTALAVACIAILGTVGALGYILVFPMLDLNPEQYGILVGGTLHELAHVVAAAIPGGEASMDHALITKLGRVALLIPVAIVLSILYKIKDSNPDTKSTKWKIKDLPVPWFIFGFLGMSLITTFNLFPGGLTNLLIALSVYLLAMAMAGLGLSINFSDFKQVGIKPVVVGVLGFAALIIVGPLLLLLI